MLRVMIAGGPTWHVETAGSLWKRKGTAVRRLGRAIFNRLGYDVVRRHDNAAIDDGYLDCAYLERRFGQIPGMVPTWRGTIHYLLAYSQTVTGDIVELGVWQGRNTCFLAAACRDSGNGIVHAVDHFRGNPGKEHRYVVRARDLSDLEQSFIRNIEDASLSDWVELHVADSAAVVLEQPIRLLFIDSEHTEERVKQELERFSKNVVSGGLVVFDDYSPSFPGVVTAAQRWANVHAASPPVRVADSLVVKVA